MNSHKEDNLLAWKRTHDFLFDLISLLLWGNVTVTVRLSEYSADKLNKWILKQKVYKND